MEGVLRKGQERSSKGDNGKGKKNSKSRTEVLSVFFSIRINHL